MSESLENLVGKAAGALREQETMAGKNSPGRKRANKSLLALLIVLAVIFLVTLLEVLAAARSENEQYRIGTLQALRAAAVEIDEYYRVNGELPDTFSNPGLRELIIYQPLSGSRFQVQMSYGPYTKPLQHDASTPLSNQELSDVLE